MEHRLRVERRIILVPHNDNIIALGVNCDTIRFDLDSDWDHMDHIFVHFSNGKGLRWRKCPLEGDTITIPWEVTLDAGMLYVTLVGYVGLDVRLTTEMMSEPYYVNPSGPAILESPLGCSPDDMQYFLHVADECAAAELVRKAAEERRGTAEEDRQVQEAAREAAERERRRAEDARRMNERLRIAHEAERLRQAKLLEDRISQYDLSLQTIGHIMSALHPSELPYIHLLETLHISAAAGAYDAESEIFELFDAEHIGSEMVVGGEIVGIP